MGNVIKVDVTGFGYSDLESWYYDLSIEERDQWSLLLNKKELSSDDETLLVETSIIIYCIEMYIDEIPNTDEFINTIANTFSRNYHLLQLKDLELIEVSGTLNMIDVNVQLKLTEKGRKLGKALNIKVEDES